MTLSARTKVKPPVSVSATYSVAGNVAVAKVAWTRVTSAWPTSYDVLYRDDVEIASGLTSQPYRDTEVESGHDYDYTVATVNVHEIESPLSTSANIGLPSYPVWETGWSLSIEQNATGSVAVRATDPDGGSLTFSKVGGTAPASVTVSSTGVVSVGATAASSYTLTLRASNGALTADISVALVVTAVAAVPGTPSNFSAVAGSSTIINLSWSANPVGAVPTSYELDRSLTGTGNWTNVFTGLATIFADTNLSASTQYFYRIRALNGVLPSGYATANATTFAAVGQAATWMIPAGNQAITFNAAQAVHAGVTGPNRAMQAGDIIEFAAGNHGRRNLQNMVGTQANPGIVRNSSDGQAVLRSPTVMVGGFHHTLSMATPNSYLEWRGNNDGPTIPRHPLYNTPMGFKFGIAANATPANIDDPTSLLKFNGRADHVVLSHFEMDGEWNTTTALSKQNENGIIGLQIQENSLLRAQNPGMFRDGFEISHFYIRRVGGEGIYIGPNYSNGSIPFRNTNIHHFLCEDIGADAINGKCHFEGDVFCHDGVVRRACTGGDPAGTPDCVSYVSSKLTAWNIWVEDGGAADGPAGNGAGVNVFIQNGPPAANPPAAGYPTYPTFPVELFNIVSIRNRGRGMAGGAQAGTSQLLFKCYNSTVLDNLERGITTGNGTVNGGFIRNCISLGNDAEIAAGGGTVAANNTVAGNPNTIFVDYANDDLRLAAAIPATGTIGTDIAADDIEGTARSALTANRGAYEQAP